VALRGEAKCGRQRREKEGSETGVGAVTRAYACVCVRTVGRRQAVSFAPCICHTPPRRGRSPSPSAADLVGRPILVSGAHRGSGSGAAAPDGGRWRGFLDFVGEGRSAPHVSR
jgi:hypothetical protein